MGLKPHSGKGLGFNSRRARHIIRVQQHFIWKCILSNFLIQDHHCLVRRSKTVKNLSAHNMNWGIFELKKLILLLNSILLLFLGLNVIKPACAETSNTVTCFTSQNPVTIDGKWKSADECSDANKVTLEKNFRFNYYVNLGEDYCRVKHDDKYIHVLLDCVR
jgi:hypothetical protein